MNQAPPIEEAPADGTHRDTPAAVETHVQQTQPPGAHATTWFWPVLVTVVGMTLLVGLLLLGLLPKLHQQESLAAATGEDVNRSPSVHVARPDIVSSMSTLTLPGTLAPNRDTMIFARSSGFVRAWTVDLGDSVKSGDLLADIDQPEVDQELRQAQFTLEQSRASVTQAIANVALTRITMERQQSLGPQLTPQQTIDIAKTNFEAGSSELLAATAVVRANEAVVRRLEKLVSFDHVTAPFDGVIAKRYIEVGNLVSAGSGTTIQPLYHLMQTDPVLILIDVPQISASSIRLGRSARIRTRNKDIGPVTATVAHLARVVDPVTRTMHVELLAANKDGLLMPGMYSEVDIEIPLSAPLLSISAASLILSGAGTRIAVVMPDGRIAIKTVVIDTDKGATLLIASGINPTDQVVLNPNGLIEDGLHVEIAIDPPAAARSGALTDAQSKQP